MATSERGHDTAGLLAMLETAADPDQAGMMSPYAVAGMAQRAAAALSAAEARERALVRRIIAAGDAIVERDDGEAYYQLYEALRDLGYDDLPSGTFDAARAALTEGERDG